MADVAADLKTWSTTAASNSPADATTVGSGLADNLQEIQKVVRQDLAHKGADIASAGTTDLGAVVGLMHDITGTTTITSFGTVSAGIWKFIKFEGALTLTHNATSLILPGAANITTANGDTAIVMSEGSGNWRCLAYTKATGLAVIGYRILLSTQTASASASLEFSSVITDTYKRYELELENLIPATDGANLHLRVSTDNGVTPITAGYAWTDIQQADTSTVTGTAGAADSKILLATNIDSNANNGGACGVIKIYRQASGTSNPKFVWDLIYDGNSAVRKHGRGQGSPSAASATNHCQLLMSAGNITSGTARLYGLI